MSKIIVCGHFINTMTGLIGIAGKREPVWLEFENEADARAAIAKHSIQIVKVFKAEELMVTVSTEEIIHTTTQTVTKW